MWLEVGKTEDSMVDAMCQESGSTLHNFTQLRTTSHNFTQQDSLYYSKTACYTAWQPVIQQDSLLYSKTACTTARQPVIQHGSL